MQVGELGRGAFGTTVLFRDVVTQEEVAVKFLQRGKQVFVTARRWACQQALPWSRLVPPGQTLFDCCWLQIADSKENVKREIKNHRLLVGVPSVVQFKEVSCTYS